MAFLKSNSYFSLHAHQLHLLGPAMLLAAQIQLPGATACSEPKSALEAKQRQEMCCCSDCHCTSSDSQPGKGPQAWQHPQLPLQQFLHLKAEANSSTTSKAEARQWRSPPQFVLYSLAARLAAISATVTQTHAAKEMLLAVVL